MQTSISFLILTAQDYYPFGMQMPKRTFSLAGSGYRFGFNTQEKDDEVYGAGNLMSANYWEYDTRLGRRWNTDPVVKVWESPYLVNSGNPIFITDPNGDDGKSQKDDKGNNTGWNGDVMDKDGNIKSGSFTLTEMNKNGYRPVGKAAEVKPEDKLGGIKDAMVGASIELTSKVSESSYFQIGTKTNRFNPKLHIGWSTGNQHTIGFNTGGISKIFTGIGVLLGVANFQKIEEQVKNNEIENVQRITEHSVNGIGTFGGLYGAAISIGWEMGRVISKNPSYRKNVRPHLQDFFGVKRDEYPEDQKCIMCDYIEQQEKNKQ